MAIAPSYEWSEFVRLSAVDADASNPKINSDGKGNIVVMWDENSKMKLGTKASGTETWNINTVSPEGVKGVNPSLAVDNSGNIISAWQVKKDGYQQILVSYSPTGGDMAKVVSTFISKAGGNAYYPEVKMDTNGNALVIWRWSDGKNYRIQAAYRAMSWVQSGALLST